jgi:cyclase
MYDLATRTAEHCFMPLTIGGGVRTVEDVRNLLLAGADKVSFNSAAVADPDVVARAADRSAASASSAPSTPRPSPPASGRSSPMAGANPPASTPWNSRRP